MRVFDVISQHPDSMFNSRSGTKDVLTLLMESDQASFTKMAVNLKSSLGENIMHFMAKENLIDFAMNLIETIEKSFDRMTATELMFSRNLLGRNSPMMIMIQRNKNFSDEEKDKILFIWYRCVENPWVKGPALKILRAKGPESTNGGIIKGEKPTLPAFKEGFQLLSANDQKQTILHFSIQSKMYDLANHICNSKYLDSARVFDIFNDVDSTPLTQILDEAFLKTILKKYSWNVFFPEIQKTVLWHICISNFNEVFHFIKESMPQDKFLKVVMIQDKDGNNSSMIAAKVASDMVLMSLLSTLVYSTDDMKIKNEFIHHKNKSGDTLLNMIMSHGDTLSMHREVVIKVCFIYSSLFLSRIMKCV